MCAFVEPVAVCVCACDGIRRHSVVENACGRHTGHERKARVRGVHACRMTSTQHMRAGVSAGQVRPRKLVRGYVAPRRDSAWALRSLCRGHARPARAIRDWGAALPASCRCSIHPTPPLTDAPFPAHARRAFSSVHDGQQGSRSAARSWPPRPTCREPPSSSESFGPPLSPRSVPRRPASRASTASATVRRCVRASRRWRSANTQSTRASSAGRTP